MCCSVEELQIFRGMKWNREFPWSDLFSPSILQFWATFVFGLPFENLSQKYLCPQIFLFVKKKKKKKICLAFGISPCVCICVDSTWIIDICKKHLSLHFCTFLHDAVLSYFHKKKKKTFLTPLFSTPLESENATAGRQPCDVGNNLANFFLSLIQENNTLPWVCHNFLRGKETTLDSLSMVTMAGLNVKTW